jgi:hypothetical protein
MIRRPVTVLRVAYTDDDPNPELTLAMMVQPLQLISLVLFMKYERQLKDNKHKSTST